MDSLSLTGHVKKRMKMQGSRRGAPWTVVFHTCTVVGRKSKFRGPCEFTRGPWWTVIFKEM